MTLDPYIKKFELTITIGLRSKSPEARKQGEEVHKVQKCIRARVSERNEGKGRAKKKAHDKPLNESKPKT